MKTTFSHPSSTNCNRQLALLNCVYYLSKDKQHKQTLQQTHNTNIQTLHEQLAIVPSLKLTACLNTDRFCTTCWLDVLFLSWIGATDSYYENSVNTRCALYFRFSKHLNDLVNWILEYGNMQHYQIFVCVMPLLDSWCRESRTKYTADMWNI